MLIQSTENSDGIVRIVNGCTNKGVVAEKAAAKNFAITTIINSKSMNRIFQDGKHLGSYSVDPLETKRGFFYMGIDRVRTVSAAVDVF